MIKYSLTVSLFLLLNTVAFAQKQSIDHPYQGKEYAYTHDGVAIATKAERLNGSYYKVLIMESDVFNPADPMIKVLKTLGRVETEFLIEKGKYNILIAAFFSKKQAYNVLAKVKVEGFDQARLLTFKDGFRS